ncbi:hypothetical protein HHK36_029264 [Tetracentron sinense]|uniref:Uncharacterized protein n=1 Tax=Tetracentron sinense TaxID=13715 RepID=A0A834YIV8_TETSI|nr:hypothetical protein HHK36_029264 [Tetracentron sinense]
MVTVLMTVTIPTCSSSLSKTPTLLTTSSSVTFIRHERCWTSEFRRTNREQKPLSAPPMDVRPSKQVAIRCSTTSSLSNPFTEMWILLSLFREIGFEERETEVLLDINPALRFTSSKSLRNRVHSLRSVGIDGFALCRLITKRPDVLTAEEIDPLICFIRDELEGEVDPVQLKRLLTVTEPRLLAGFARKVRLLIHHGVPPQKLTHVLNNVNLSKVFCHKPDEEIERTIIFLNRFGGVHLIVKRPSLLNYDLETQLIPRTGFLMELSGGDEDATGVVLRKLPAILTYTVEHFESHVEFLRSFVGLTDLEIFKIVLVYPNVFSASKERKLRPRIEFLKQCRLSSNDIFRFLTKAPLFIGLSFKENLSTKLGFLVKIGYENRTKELALAMGAVTRTSCENMQKVIGVFLSYGFSFEDILAMSEKHPQILQYNHKSLEKKMEYLIEEMDREIGELLAFPAFLGYKLDDRIRHSRLELMLTRSYFEAMLLLLLTKAKAAELLICSEMMGPDVAQHALVSASCKSFEDVATTLIKNGVDKNCMDRILLRSAKPSLHANIDCMPLVATIVSRPVSMVKYCWSWLLRVLAWGLVSITRDIAVQLAKKSAFGSSINDIFLQAIITAKRIYSTSLKVFSPLHFVAGIGNAELLHPVLHQSREDINKQDESGSNVEAFWLLIMSGADISVKNRDGNGDVPLTAPSSFIMQHQEGTWKAMPMPTSCCYKEGLNVCMPTVGEKQPPYLWQGEAMEVRVIFDYLASTRAIKGGTLQDHP